MERAPDSTIARQSLPAPLIKAIRAVFQGSPPGVALVGGTALAGFYAGHRRSDDLDLFTADTVAQAMAVAAIKGLADMGATLTDERASPNFFHVLVRLDSQTFTAQAVLDANLHKVGKFNLTSDGIRVASLSTLRKMKIATLVSRCSEKDLYDLTWLMDYMGWPSSTEELIALGHEIDAGVEAEGLLASITMARLRVTSCGFAVEQGVTSGEVLRRIEIFRAKLQSQLLDFLETGGAVPPSIAPLIRKLRRRK